VRKHLLSRLWCHFRLQQQQRRVQPGGDLTIATITTITTTTMFQRLPTP